MEDKKEKSNDKEVDEILEDKIFGNLIKKLKKCVSNKIKLKISEILKIIYSVDISEDDLRRIVFDGIPDEFSDLRSLIWKIILNYLPLNCKLWEETLILKRRDYSFLKQNYSLKLEFDSKEQKEMENYKKKKKKKSSDHPLNDTDDSIWKNYFECNELREEIEKDVRRTRTQMSFFFMPVNKNEMQNYNSNDIVEQAENKRNKPFPDNTKVRIETHADVLTRILYIYAKLNPEVRYIQGMNEVLAPIYYCFSQDKCEFFSDTESVEADSFFCFCNLMDDLKDIFLRSKDNTPNGINTSIKHLVEILRVTDREIYNLFYDQKIEVQFFAFRWYTLLLTQEFEMPEILRLWDSILSDKRVLNFMTYICLGIIRIKRNEIIDKDFATIMLSMQNLEKIEVEKLIYTAVDILTEYNNITKKI